MENGPDEPKEKPSPWGLILAAIGAVVVPFGIAGMIASAYYSGAANMLAAAFCIAGIVAEILVLRRLFTREFRGGVGNQVLKVIAGLISLAGISFLALMSLLVFIGGHGRPYRVGGKPVTARGSKGGDEWRASLEIDLDRMNPLQREIGAKRWLRDALAEHASIASFAQLSLDLLALRAPARLLEGCARAMTDEIEHARLCFAVASCLAGETLGPGALEVGARGSVRSAVALVHDTLVDGCWHEGASADQARRDGATAHPALMPVLNRLADDETRHAEFAWSLLEWLVESGGEDAVQALRSSLEAVRSRPEVLARAQAILLSARLGDGRITQTAGARG